MLGVVLAITAGFFWGTGGVLARIGLQRVKPSVGVFISLLASLLLVGSLCLIIEFEALVSLSKTTLLWFGLIGVIYYALGRQFNYLGIKYIGVTRATAIFASSPLFAILLAVAFTGEKLSLLIVAGALSIITGLYMLITSE
ncbi:EamA family transporter [Chloroflexota bacterium]